MSFNTGNNLFWRYTDQSEAVTIKGITYQPETIRHDNIEVSGNLEEGNLRIEISKESALAIYYRDKQPGQIVSARVMHGHTALNELVAAWVGRIASVQRQEASAEILCEPVATSIQKPGLRRPYQYGCPYVLFGKRCGANRTNFRQQLNVVAVGGNTLQLPANWQKAGLKTINYHGGLVIWYAPSGEKIPRTILNVLNIDGNDWLLLNDKTRY